MPLPIKTHGEGYTLNRVVSKQDILDHMEGYRDAVSFYRSYPDLFIDFLIKASGPECTFKLYPYQRLILRAMARYTDVNLTFSRGTSKSFLNDLWQMIKGILYSGTKAAIAASTKGQSAKILDQKTSEIIAMLPAIGFEIKKIIKIKDDITILFKNGSWIMNVAAKGSTRGDRYFGEYAVKVA